jgi:hypothetical protein
MDRRKGQRQGPHRHPVRVSEIDNDDDERPGDASTRYLDVLSSKDDAREDLRAPRPTLGRRVRRFRSRSRRFACLCSWSCEGDLVRPGRWYLGRAGARPASAVSAEAKPCHWGGSVLLNQLSVEIRVVIYNTFLITSNNLRGKTVRHVLPGRV